MKKIVLSFLVLCMLLLSFVCKSKADDGTGTVYENYTHNSAQVSEDLTEYFNSVTDDMLASCNTYPVFDAYWEEPLVLLNEFDDGIQLYGISVGEESAMLLYINGEKVLVPYTFKNFYQELPKLNSTDIDNDGIDEIIISFRTGTGSPGNWYALLVCDYTAAWDIYKYDDYLQDIDKFIDYEYEDEYNRIILKKDGENLTEIELPEWTKDYPYQGVIDFENDVRFDAETMEMEITPWILLEDSLPYTPIIMVFSVKYMDGKFEIEYQHIVESYKSEDVEKYIDEYVVLDDDTEVEGVQWIEHDTNQCLRIRLQYKIQPKDRYRHKEDYFLLFDEDSEVTQVLRMDYENIKLGYGNDFNAYFEDVTFDGNQDLLIHIGSWGSSQYYCAFIYDNGDYRREESFEKIPEYKAVAGRRQIIGHVSTINTDIIETYTYSNGSFELIDRVEYDK